MDGITIHITPSQEHSSPAGKLCDAEIHFGAGPFEGLKLVGFAVWERRAGGAGRRNVTFPARSYSVNGERRSYALLRPIGAGGSTDAIRDLVLAAYERYERGDLPTSGPGDRPTAPDYQRGPDYTSDAARQQAERDDNEDLERSANDPIIDARGRTAIAAETAGRAAMMARPLAFEF